MSNQEKGQIQEYGQTSEKKARFVEFGHKMASLATLRSGSVQGAESNISRHYRSLAFAFIFYSVYCLIILNNQTRVVKPPAGGVG